MTKLLEKAFEEAARLPELEQNALAQQLLDEIRSEAKWDRSFAGSEDILEELANEALEEKREKSGNHSSNEAGNGIDALRQRG